MNLNQVRRFEALITEEVLTFAHEHGVTFADVTVELISPDAAEALVEGGIDVVRIKI